MPSPRPSAADVAALRQFNRFYTRRIGLLDEGHLGGPWSLSAVRVLYEIANRDGPTAAQIGQDLGLDAGYLSRLLRTFAHKGLIKRDRSAADARQSHLRLTKKGEREFGALNARANDEIAAVLETLSAPDRKRLRDAADTIQSILGDAPPRREPYMLRPHQIGDMGWMVHRQAILYNQEFGWDERYEMLILRVVADFIEEFDPKKERAWIAERNGEIVGGIYVKRKSATVAQLRMLYVEPSARGLGIGRRLVQEVIRFARQAGYRKITLWTNSVLVSARKIYEAEGFTLVSEEPNEMFGPRLVGQVWELQGLGARG